MVKKTKVKLLAIILPVAFLALGNVAQAEDTATTPWQQKKEERQAQKQEKLEQRCSIVEEKINIKVSRFENNKVRRVNAYNNLRNRVSKFIDKLSSQGYDVSKLKSDLVTLDEKIKKFSSDYASYITLLKSTKDYACGQSEGQFKGKLSEARKQLQIVHQSALEVRSYFQGTIRPDIQAIRAQKKTDTTETE